jgi:heme-dependent oxidative N-demethylase alpha subunit-like protein
VSDFPYVPLEPKGWRMAMGLRPLDLDHWLEVDERRDDELELKRQLLDSSFDVVVATRPEGDEGSRELLTEVTRFLETHHADVALEVRANEHPVVAAARLVQEDLCVLVRSDVWRLQAACVCFPSRWNLASKLGTTLDDIHRPVPRYDVELSRPTNAFFDRLSPERSFWRLNWTLIDSPALHQPTSARHSPHGDLATWFFRVERQTLRRLPESGAIVFTIRNYVASAKELCDSHEEFGATLLLNLDTAPEAMREYKGWVGVADRLRSSLAADAD